MHEFCPLCNERGFRRRIKALQINLHEAVWACEGDKCEWPFGYEDFIYFTREAGNTWSCYWDDIKPTIRSLNESVPVSTELSLYTPPETPAEAVIKDCLSDTPSSNNINATNDISSSITASEVKSISINNSLNAYCTTNDSPEKDNINLKNISTNADSNNCTNTTQHLSDIKNISKDVLAEIEQLELEKTTLIPKSSTCVDKSNSEIDNNKIQLIKKSEDVSIVKNTYQKQVDEKISDLKKQANNLDEKSASNVKVTTVEIDGLPPIILSYEVPTTLAISTTVSNKNTNPNITQCVTTSPSTSTNTSTTNANGTHKLLTLINKRSPGKNVSDSKQYAKFSFSAIKKKLQAANNDSLNSDKKCSSNSDKGTSDKEDIEQSQKHNSCKTIASCSSIDSNKPIKDEVVKSDKSTSENDTLNSSLNLDTLLNDFLTEESLCSKVNDGFILPDIDEDWINSLLH